ncbi:MAG TPA: hypothetical protein VGB24_16020 [Longimicrobium sp.]|jgi:hypothetical protein|uniref:hypothetical protein n=1 Tax=Longimicrobium sp. TaxID=2029185 RepID=UPI002ED7F65D
MTIPALNPAALDAMKERFLARVGDFGDFQDQGSRYWADERAYKDEFAARCREALTPALFATAGSAEGAQAVAAATHRLLTVRLNTTSTPQNLLSWRYFDFLRKMHDGERVAFAPAFGDLLLGEGPGAERLGRFSRVMWPVWKRIQGGNPYALSRNFPTLFLMMLYPDHDVAVRSDMFGAAARELLGDWLLRYAPFDAVQYQAVIDFARGVRRQLEAWTWRPRDMIDVHSFLWVATRDDRAYSPPAEVSPTLAGDTATPAED